MSSTTRRAAGRLALTVGALAAALTGLHAAGAVLPGPPLADTGAWSTWAAGDPLVAAFGAVRVVALAAGWWVLGTTVLAVAARLLRWRAVVAVTDRLVVPALRRSVRGAVGAGLVAATLAGPVRPLAADPLRATAAATAAVDVGAGAPADAAAPALGTAALRRLAGEPPAGHGTVTLRRLAPDVAQAGPGAGIAALRRLDRDLPPPAPAATVPEASPAGATRAVGAGEHFWSIAADVVAEVRGRPGTDVEVSRYWEALLAANRHRLADPANPDLLFPGQALVLPPVPDAPG